MRALARSLGMLLWELVAGQVPWKGLDDVQVTTQVWLLCVCILHQRNGPPPASGSKDQQRGR